ncbi:hypothetical protein [Bifidobacterium oedipodis]|uniref:Phosphoribosyltransferase n=1 Tax=Bifidobacterium oedipodis TaxID=2675322 RepID=A0A7Y0ENW4_9BIFI|nr:hypothetical protein [Bifidobacterium sp. DSM 109957]NMM93749.1 hypothetical protein [Bifidobacterium sp. DSM 109957]
MSDPRQTSADRQLELAKIERMGSYARGVIYRSKFGHVCPVCAGPKKMEYELCIACAGEARQASALGAGGVTLADIVRFGHYAYKGEQMYRVMQGYKSADDPAAGEYQKDVKYIAADALAVHYPCIAKLAGSMPTAWATIPSTCSSRNYGKPHVLTNLVAPFMARMGIQQLQLQANEGKVHNRIDPQVFSLATEPRRPQLAHVLLIEDSWTSGATVQSVAAMLRLRGAAHITVYCMARIIDLDWIASNFDSDVVKGFRHLRYKDQCPWLLCQHPV